MTVSGAKLDGIHVRLAGVMITNCTVDMRGNPLGQGIDISYNMDIGVTMVEGCTRRRRHGGHRHALVDGDARAQPRQPDDAARDLDDRDVDGEVMDNKVRDAHGVGIFCGDHSMCMIDRNDVAGTRPRLGSGDLTLRGFGVLASFQSEADLRGNHLGSNPVPTGAIINSQVATTH